MRSVCAREMYPGDIVPNSKLKRKKIENATLPPPILNHTMAEKVESLTSSGSVIQTTNSFNNNGSTTTNNKRPQLDLATGYAILKYAYDHWSFDNSPTKCNNGDYDDDDGGSGSYFSFFGFGSLISGGRGYAEQKKELGILEKRKRLSYLEAKEENVRDIDLEFLKRHNITLEVLLTAIDYNGDKGVPITELKSAHIVNTFHDLCELKYEHRNLTLNRRCFNVGHIVQCFLMDANSLQLDIADVIRCQFTPAELESLQLSLPEWIEEGAIKFHHFSQLRYKPLDLARLGIRRFHLKKLGITYDTAIEMFRWTPTEFNTLDVY